MSSMKETVLTNQDFRALCYRYLLELKDCDLQAFVCTMESFGATKEQVAELMERLDLIEGWL